MSRVPTARPARRRRDAEVLHGVPPPCRNPKEPLAPTGVLPASAPCAIFDAQVSQRQRLRRSATRPIARHGLLRIWASSWWYGDGVKEVVENARFSGLYFIAEGPLCSPTTSLRGECEVGTCTSCGASTVATKGLRSTRSATLTNDDGMGLYWADIRATTRDAGLYCLPRRYARSQVCPKLRPYGVA